MTSYFATALLLAYLFGAQCSDNVLDLFPEFQQMVDNLAKLKTRVDVMEPSVGHLQVSVNDLQEPVAFSAYYSETQAQQSKTMEGNQIFIFDQTESNKGNAYSPQTGKFTAPRAGLYAFTWTLCADSRYSYDGGYGEFGSELIVGGIARGKLHVDAESKYDDVCSTAFVIVQVEAGQEVFLRSIYNDQGRLLSKENQCRTTFSGWKILFPK